ncbi:uncharacterized protein EDB91DRAFT_57947 [Suillus paluster]|uniref:uncharacterized protein n=1 Tax=Suillus paluster TaxID=48578 RepID=UPI001B87EBBC|nr:uncharacterized protein EDB91DRAFT_57947 [Suillus paluster]KAG1726624.1 hypothetical protein EDB91DRAFT_57947 [Suillus paluster]
MSDRFWLSMEYYRFVDGRAWCVLIYLLLRAITVRTTLATSISSPLLTPYFMWTVFPSLSMLLSTVLDRHLEPSSATAFNANAHRKQLIGNIVVALDPSIAVVSRVSNYLSRVMFHRL